MWFDRLGARLRRMYSEAGHGQKDMSEGAEEALERRLLAAHADAYPGPALAPAGVRGFFAAHRFAVAGVGVALATAAACQVPLDYEREFGASVTCELARETWPEGQVDSIARELAAALGAERLALRVHDDGGAMQSFRVDLWGADVDDAGLIAALHERAPQLPANACKRAPLAGTVHGTLGGRLGYSLLDLDLDHADVESTRQEILEALEVQGLQGEAQVEIREADGKREVQIRIEAHGPGPHGE